MRLRWRQVPQLPWVFGCAAAALAAAGKGRARVRAYDPGAGRHSGLRCAYFHAIQSTFRRRCVCAFCELFPPSRRQARRFTCPKTRCFPRLVFPVVFVVVGFPQTARAMLSLCRRYIVGLFLVAVVQVHYHPAQCSSLFKYLSSEYNLSQVSTRHYT